ncbi:Methionyl-tRNA formyltransferase [Corynebacterium capitovis DSM 44611]|uniref:methionyl-tRNA formyltransferase n=1 Tax=Corynebacterium capitovis TaxID=131081 RepID=UPI000377DBEC|nr:methionyl-tRNA formyltransferase [Corynebacterium capitovis]WKD57605.1 Methionyl-tRNA formyltransferase [Corynebacterium capitovis DSM 44611]
MRLVFAGTPEPAAVALDKLLASEHDVVGVVTRPDARRGRGRSYHPSPVKELAVARGIPVLTPESLKTDERIRTQLRDLQPDAIPVVAYGNLVPADMLEIPRHGWVNLHFSLLPEWRGAAPVQSAIHSGQPATGVTTFRIDEGLDTGDVLGAVEHPIRPTDTAEDLLNRLAGVGGDLLVETMTALERGSASPKPQPAEGTYAPKVSQDDARVHWGSPAEDIDRMARAYTPAPGPWTTFHGQRVKLGPVTVTDSDTLGAGQLRVEKHAVTVGTATKDVQLGGVQPPGKKMMAAADWGRGLGKPSAGEGMMFE